MLELTFKVVHCRVLMQSAEKSFSDFSLEVCVSQEVLQRAICENFQIRGFSVRIDCNADLTYVNGKIQNH